MLTAPIQTVAMTDHMTAVQDKTMHRAEPMLMATDHIRHNKISNAPIRIITNSVAVSSNIRAMRSSREVVSSSIAVMHNKDAVVSSLSQDQVNQLLHAVIHLSRADHTAMAVVVECAVPAAADLAAVTQAVVAEATAAAVAADMAAEDTKI